MSNVVVVGAQWGDEGKGKIVDWLSERADVVVRFQGGHNAGHTLVIDGNIFKLSLLPSGVVRGGKLSVIGNGVVIDPWALKGEIDEIAAKGVAVSPDNLLIAENACLILPLHRELDQAREAARGGQTIGTTGRGIGPAYEDKVGRRAIRMCDLSSLAALDARLDELLSHHNALRRGFGIATINKEGLKAELSDIALHIVPYCGAVWSSLDSERRAGRRILFEGAQGAMLDIDHGTYPYVTSSNTVAGQAAAGSGMGPGAIDYVLGITKAYTTRVGSGPFPTELDDAIGLGLGERGHEFGTVTGRRRRCGWFDGQALKQVVNINSVSGLCITKLDVLDGLEKVLICTDYEESASGEVQPVYEELPGWQASTAEKQSPEELPGNARAYLERIEEVCEVRIDFVSTGPDREHTVVLNNPFD